ncbi:ABC transporter ATP-binding protein [Halodesulfovibrio aestuarii]|uniref:ABC transporter ATP-binding protein n=2 Tax=Halodesulfovibrio aestuarii TaxID=126333 RepID=A0ABV4JPV0_9BACT
MQIEIVDIHKTFTSSRGVQQVLRGISFSLEAGKIAALTGCSGSGKTTLLHCIGGIETPDSGSVVCFSHQITAMSAVERSRFMRKDLGVVFQKGNLLAYLTVAENIAFPLKLNRVGKKESASRIDELLEQVGLSDAKNAMPHELSGGELQRASIARALAHKPKLLLADEPTASLDSVTGREVVNLISSLSYEQKCTTIFSTHDMEIINIADNIFQLHDGKLVAAT